MWFKVKVEEIHSGIVWVEADDEMSAHMEAVGRVKTDYDQLGDTYIVDHSDEKPEDVGGY